MPPVTPTIVISSVNHSPFIRNGQAETSAARSTFIVHTFPLAAPGSRDACSIRCMTCQATSAIRR